MIVFPCPHSPQETGNCFLAGNHRTQKVEANHSIAHGYHLEARILLHSVFISIVQTTHITNLHRCVVIYLVQQSLVKILSVYQNHM